jgi:transposase-like protein
VPEFRDADGPADMPDPDAAGAGVAHDIEHLTSEILRRWRRRLRRRGDDRARSGDRGESERLLVAALSGHRARGMTRYFPDLRRRLRNLEQGSDAIASIPVVCARSCLVFDNSCGASSSRKRRVCVTQWIAFFASIVPFLS